MLAENQNFYRTRLDVSVVPSDKITCLHHLNLKGSIHNLQVYVTPIAMYCDDTGMYRTVRSANPTYRERESTRIDQVVDPIARDSETRFDTCQGLKHMFGTQAPRISVPNRTHNKPILQSLKP
jgi:hypothetical protein